MFHCLLYNRSKHAELLLVTADEQFIQQIYFETGSESRKRPFFLINLSGSNINSSLYLVQLKY